MVDLSERKKENLNQRRMALKAPFLILRNAELELEVGRRRSACEVLKARNEELEEVIDFQRAITRGLQNKRSEF